MRFCIDRRSEVPEEILSFDVVDTTFKHAQLCFNCSRTGGVSFLEWYMFYRYKNMLRLTNYYQAFVLVNIYFWHIVIAIDYSFICLSILNSVSIFLDAHTPKQFSHSLEIFITCLLSILMNFIWHPELSTFLAAQRRCNQASSLQFAAMNIFLVQLFYSQRIQTQVSLLRVYKPCGVMLCN